MGDGALSFQLGEQIDPALNARLIAFAARIAAEHWPGVHEIVPTYRAVSLCYDPALIRGAALEARLRALWERPAPPAPTGRLWEVPCLYGHSVGADLAALAELHAMPPDELVARHAAAEYRVFMIGFAPGFAYLGGLPERLHTPRLAVPRQHIAAGAVGIGGQQSCITSVPGPSGWRFIGWVPWRSFDPGRAEPCLFRAGDRLRFRPVSEAEAQAIAAGAGPAPAPRTAPQPAPQHEPAP